jgi:SecD/SecF fusion protein
MRNKGFFWFLTILLTAVCLYQLSFTWVTSNTEASAEKEAQIQLEKMITDAKSNGNIAYLPNSTKVDFNDPEAKEIAKGALLNQILIDKAEKPVYPGVGSTFQDVKKRSLAFGLDLVGGMSVTLEISVPELIRSFARNQRDLQFTKPYEKAVSIYTSNGGDFLDIFEEQNKKFNGNKLVVRLLNIEEIDELNINSSNSDVFNFLRTKVESSMEGVELILEKRINQFGVAQPNIQKDPAKNRLYIELPGVQDEATVVAKMKSTANLQFYATYNLNEIGQQWQQASILSAQEEVAATDLSDTTAADSTQVTSLNDKTKALNSKVKSLSDYVKSAGEYALGQIGYVNPKDKGIVEAMLRRKDIVSVFRDLNIMFMWSAEAEPMSDKSKEKVYTLYAVKNTESGKAFVGGKDITTASAGFDQSSSKVTVDLAMSVSGSDRWAQMTEENKYRAIVISMDSVVYSAPRVENAITGGRTQISGNFTTDEAKDLAGLLNGGSLPAPCVVKEQMRVGPTIGLENSKAGMISFAFAFLAVLLYMYFYYGKAGMAANVALCVNIILIFGSLASFGAVLTLAGIAGIVLTIGTAVDANILVFERVREEQARGVDLAESLNRGFSKALPAIIDANVTHLLVAIILVIFGKGEMKSFATTLIIGIFTSIFSAIVISKLVMYNWLEKGKSISFNTSLSKGLFQNFNFDWVGKRKYFYIFSISVTIIGVIGLFSKGLKQSVEFTGGRTFVAKFENKADIVYLRNNLEKVFVEPNGEVSSIDLKTKSNDYNVEIITNYKLKNDDATAEVKEKLMTALDNSKAKLGAYKIMESRTISASVSSELWISSAKAISLALLAIFLYILLRFGSWQYSIGAIIGLAHDAFFVITVFALFHGMLPFSLDVNQAFIAAILTVIGYSMNDTVIVFDRIRENLRNSADDADQHEIINKSLNTTISRTINTSMILFVVVLIMFIFSGPAIKGFLFAMLVGVVIGTYSSLCVATPILIDFSKKLKK